MTTGGKLVSVSPAQGGTTADVLVPLPNIATLRGPALHTLIAAVILVG